MSDNNKVNLFQNVGTILALVISIIALFVSIYEANLMHSQQKAMVWPYLDIAPNYNGEGFSFYANNNGIGPALVKSMELSLNGKPVEDYDELLDLIKPDRTIGYDRLKMGTLNNTVVKAGEKRLLFQMPWDDETRSMLESIQGVRLRVQYCSVLDDCWVFDTETSEHQPGKFKASVEFEN